MEDFKDICKELQANYPLFCEVEDYYADNRITNATFRITAVDSQPVWARVSVPTKQAGEALVKRFIRASILGNYAMYGGDERTDEAIIALKAVAREALRHNGFSWIADRVENLLIGLIPVE